MKANTIIKFRILTALLLISSFYTFSQVKTISFNQYCAAGFSKTWTVDIDSYQLVRVTYLADIDVSDNIAFFNGSGGYPIHYDNGYCSGTTCTTTAGTVSIGFYAGVAGYKSFIVQCYEESPLTQSGDFNILGNIAVSGSSTVYGNSVNWKNVGIGTANPKAKLDVGAFINNGQLGTVFGRLSEGNATGDGTFLGVRGYNTSPIYSKSFAIEHNFYGQTNSSINFLRGGSTTGGFITFNTNNNTEQMRINEFGSIGIGTSNPICRLDVKMAPNQHIQFVDNVNGTFTGAAGIVSINDNNTAYTPIGFYASKYFFGNGNVGIGTTLPNAKLQIGNSYSDTGSPIMRIAAAPSGSNGVITDALHIDTYDGANFNQGIAITMGLQTTAYGEYTSRIIHYGNTGATRASKLQLQTHSVNEGVWNTGLLMNEIGYVGIGTIKPTHLLSVNGTIRAKEVVVDLCADLADYVFDTNYELMPLPAVEKYVKENKHLPEIPSAVEVKENGMSVGEMQNKLLQKIEELTLYVIEQQKQIEELKKNQK